MSKSESLGESLPKEQARVREILSQYLSIGPAGAIGAVLIEADLRAADEAIISGDLTTMIQAYATLKEIEA